MIIYYHKRKLNSQGRVASYDDEYRDQGLLWHMGGLGAKCLEDQNVVDGQLIPVQTSI